MKKLLGILALIVIIAIVIFFLKSCSFPGPGPGPGPGPDPEPSDPIDVVNPPEPDDTPPPEDSNEPQEIVIKVSVVENDYFYDSERVDLDTLAEKIREFDEKPTVKIIDDNASLKAYNKLLGKLEELEVSYIEEN